MSRWVVDAADARWRPYLRPQRQIQAEMCRHVHDELLLILLLLLAPLTSQFIATATSMYYRIK